MQRYLLSELHKPVAARQLPKLLIKSSQGLLCEEQADGEGDL
jgi:hypothetical protein